MQTGIATIFYCSSNLRASTTLHLATTDQQIWQVSPHLPFSDYTNKNEELKLHHFFSIFFVFSIT